MPERIISGTRNVETIRMVLEDIGGNEMGFRPMIERFTAEGGEGQRIAYEVVVPYGRIREIFWGAGGKREPVIATFWPGNELSILASKRAIKYIDGEVQEYRDLLAFLVEDI